MGCPIRKSMDQSLFSAPHGLSQSITSFIASYCLGIHQTPFSRLIRSRKSKAVFVVLSPGGRLEDKERSFFRSKVIRFSRLRSPMQGLRRHRLVYLTWNKTTCSAVPEGTPGYRPDAVEPVVLIYSLCTMSKSCVRLDGKTLEKCFTVKSEGWWVEEDLNLRPHAYQACALTN